MFEVLGRVFLLSCAVIFACAGCNSHKKPTPDSVKINSNHKAVLTLFEERLLNLVQESENLARDIELKKSSSLDARMRLNQLANVWSEFASEHKDNLETQILYGKFLRSARYDKDAYSVFLSVDKKNPNVAVVKQQLSTFETEQKEFKKAYLHIKEAVRLEPQNAVYQAQLGELLFKAGEELVKSSEISKEQRDDEMLSAFKSASQNNSDINFLIRYAQAFYDVKNPNLSEALMLWQKAETLAPLGFEKDEVRVHIANILIELNKFDEANSVLQKIITQNYSKERDALKSLLEKKKSEILNSQNQNE